MGIPPQIDYKNSTLRLTPERKKFCDMLDALYGPYTELEASASEMFLGALIAINRSDGNPDWVSQAANSLREIIYPLLSSRSEFKALKNQISKDGKHAEYKKVGKMYGKLSKLTHHFCRMSKLDFEKLLVEFDATILYVLPQQIDLHRDIETYVSLGP